MADRFYSAEFGTTMKYGVTETAVASPSQDVELRITYDAAGNSKIAALLALEAIRQKLQEETWPPN